MDEKKSRTLLFILGISIGLLVGATVVYISTPKESKSGEVSENMIEQIVNKVYGLISSKKEAQDTIQSNKVASINPKKKEVVHSDTMNMLANESTDSAGMSIGNGIALNDSSNTDSSSNLTVSRLNLIDDIVVKKDELIATKVVELLNLDYSNNKPALHADSVLQAVSGIRDTKKMTEVKYQYQVELWQSPINYKGYKLAKNKLVLFGVDEDAPLKLYNLGDNTYLKCAEMVYRLDSYNDYKAFEKVSNSQVLNQLIK